MFEKLFRKKAAPLTGAPQVLRTKTYSAQSGYVYQYHYEGHRPFRRGGNDGTEYVFQVSADRKTSAPVSVFLDEGAVSAWEFAHGRTLSSSECYAIAKVALFQAFDEREQPALMRQDVNVRAADVEGILTTLDID
jgi:hypothetical protein